MRQRVPRTSRCRKAWHALTVPQADTNYHPRSSELMYRHRDILQRTRASSVVASRMTTETATQHTATPSTAPKKMVRRIIDADNSCLFNAVGYGLRRKRKVGVELRQMITEAVRGSPEVYNEVIVQLRSLICRVVSHQPGVICPSSS